MDRNKLNEVLETPQVHMFKHENVFSNSFKEEISKSTDFLPSNTIDTPPMSSSITPSSITTNLVNSVSVNSFQNIFTSNIINSNNAPKKNLLFRTISQSDNELKHTDSLNSSFSSGYLSSSHNSVVVPLTPESIDQNINNLLNRSGFRMLNELNTSPPDQAINLFKRKKTADDLGPNLDEKLFIKATKLSGFSEQDLKTTEFLIDQNSFGKSESRSSSIDNNDVFGTNDQNLEIQQIKHKSRSINSSSELRKQEIRNSNREAARRCRERRRTYIETLETNIRSLETKQKVLISENSLLQKEVQSLKKIISDNRYQCNNNQQSLVTSEFNYSTGKNGPLMLAYFDINQPTANSDQQQTVSLNSGNANNQQVLQKILNALINNNLDKSNNGSTGVYSNNTNNEQQSHLNSLN